MCAIGDVVVVNITFAIFYFLPIFVIVANAIIVIFACVVYVKSVADLADGCFATTAAFVDVVVVSSCV